MHIRYLFELVFSMTTSSECRVSHVFSAFMRKATHISAEEDPVLLRPPKNGEKGESEGRFGPITGGATGGKGGRPFASKKNLSFLRKSIENSGFRLYMKWVQKKRPELGRWRIRWWRVRIKNRTAPISELKIARISFRGV